MGALPIIAGVGLATQIYGQIKGGQAQADAENKNAELKRQQADELMSREAINEDLMRRRGALMASAYSAHFASTGREGGGIGGVLQMNKDLADNIANSQRDAAFKAKMLRAGADIDQSLASDSAAAGYISGFGTLLTGVAKGYQLYGPPSGKSPTSLPEIGNS